MDKLELIATSAFGLEAIVAQELKQLGYTDLKVENGKVTFSSDLSGIARCNLWLRSADRILLKIGEFKALTFTELFEQTRALPWPDWLPAHAHFPVEGKSVSSQLYSVSDCQAIVKKAVVEKMKQKYHKNWFEENGPKYKIEVALLKDTATLTIDTSGAGLHKRGYRKLSAPAPLKETLAAAMVMISRWKPEKPLIDPFCGSGTIPIEAALIGKNIAPGIKRNFIAEEWPNIKKSVWQKTREEAYDLIKKNQALDISGYDIDPEVLKLAKFHAEKAGVKNDIQFKNQAFAELKTPKEQGFLICNPPYGERLSEKKEVENLYKEMKQIFKNMPAWNFYVLTSHPRFENIIGRKAEKRRKLYNGRIECTYYQYFALNPPSSSSLKTL